MCGYRVGAVVLAKNARTGQARPETISACVVKLNEWASPADAQGIPPFYQEQVNYQLSCFEPGKEKSLHVEGL
jgi:hypothetical protein